MFNPSVTQSLVQTRIDEIHRLARSDGASRRHSGTPSPAEALASHVTRAIVRVFDGGRPARGETAPIHAMVGRGSTARWSPRS